MSAARNCDECRLNVEGKCRSACAPQIGHLCTEFRPKVATTQEATADANARGEGYKADQGKPDWTIFPFDGAEPIVRVLEVGARKYARDNWRKVPDAVNRYRAAALRHLAADALGEINDPETGLPHLAHAGCCLLFALALRRTSGEDRRPK